MLRTITGVAAVLEGKQVDALWACAKGRAAAVAGTESLMYRIRLERDGTQPLVVEVLRTELGEGVVRRVAPDVGATAPARLDDDAFLALSAAWPVYSGSFDPDPADQPGRVVELVTPLRPGAVRLDRRTLGERLLGGRATQAQPVTRRLADARFSMRLPAGYHPRTPAGLLLWVHASPEGRPPASLAPIADAMNLVVVSAADAGNDRAIADRFQLVLDAVANAQARCHIDPSRVYAIGISGGGKVAGALWACFPDVVAGAIPVVGLAVYEATPAPGGKLYPALFGKPGRDRLDRLRTQRLAAITGSADFNRDPVVGAFKVLERDKLAVKLWDIQGLGHTMPEASVLEEAVRWVDEPWRTAADARARRGDELLAALDADLARGPIEAGTLRTRLVEITREAPWTPAAWTAFDRLTAASPRTNTRPTPTPAP